MAEHKEIITTERTIHCRLCNSTDVSKYGKYKEIQNYICKFCGRKFAQTDAFSDMKYTKDFIINAMTYYYNGMSFKNIYHTFNDLSEKNIPKSTIWRWIIKYSKMANQYVITLKPKLGDTWIADETVIDIWGTQYWYWDIIDEKTRFLIASHLSKTRSEKDATKLFYMAKLRSKTRPKFVRTDKLGQYNGPFNKVFYSNIPAKRVEHLQSEGFDSPTNINLIERFHGAIKQRTKVMRDLKRKYSARIIMDGFVTHYNFFMEHEYLDNSTPAQMGGIGGGISNWGDMIHRAQQHKRSNPVVELDWEAVSQID